MDPNFSDCPPPGARSEDDLRSLLKGAEALWTETLGAGAREELLAMFRDALVQQPWQEESLLRAQVEQALCARYGTRRLAAEREDERLRDLAVSQDAALIRYERTWSRRLARLQSAFPERWRVPGLSDEDVRDELTLRLIQAIRTGSEALLQLRRPGKEWGLLFLQQERRALRRSFRLEITPADLSPAIDRGISEEERLIEEQSSRLQGEARARAEASLSRPQRRWFAAMRLSANAGAFFERGFRVSGRPDPQPVV